MTWLKHCACGRSYTYEQWQSRRCMGLQHYREGETHDLRNCDCGSTLAVRILPEPAQVQEDADRDEAEDEMGRAA